MVRLFPFPEIRVQLLPPTKAKRVAGVVRNLLRVILLFDRILIAPFPFVYHALRADQKLSARALSISFLIVGFTFLPEMFDSTDMDLMWKYKLPIEASLFIGYFLARVGWHEVAALLTALVLTVEYHYSVSLLPKVYTSVVQLSGLFVPFMLLVITNHWIIVLLFYFTNVFLFIYYLRTYPPESGIQLEINLIAVVISMMLYSSCAHNFNHWLLKRNEQRYVQFFRESFEAIAVVDWQGIVREVNQSFADLFSTPKVETSLPDFVDRSIFEFIDVDQRSQVAKMFLAQTDSIHIGDQVPRVEINGLRLDGQVIRVQIGLKMLRHFHGFSENTSNSPPSPNSEIFTYGKQLKRNSIIMMSFHDLTAQQQAQAAIVEAEREKHANDAKSKFLANMSHEIRTPLNGVLGMLQLLEDTPLNKEQRLFLKNSVDSANYLLLLINDILDFSKIEAGLLPIDEYEFRLVDCIESVVDLLHANARTKGIDLYAFVHPRCPATVLGDAARLRQVLMNLVSNAIKFTTKGKVLVQCDVDMLDVQQNSIKLRFQVIDTGIGLKPESIDRLFQRFYQVDDRSALRRNHGGTGLGLAISRNLVGLMGGEIGVNSKYGEGSTFWFTISCKKSPSALALPSAQPPASQPHPYPTQHIRSYPELPVSSQPRPYSDLPPQQLQHHLQHQLQKEIHYQLQQQVSAARSYTEMPARSYAEPRNHAADRSFSDLSSTQSYPLQPSRSLHDLPFPPAPLSSPASISRRSSRSSSRLSATFTTSASASSTPNSSPYQRSPSTTVVPPTIPEQSLLSVALVAVSDNVHTRNILGEYFKVWGYTDVMMYKTLAEGLPYIYDQDRYRDKKLIVILCIKSTQLDSATQECVIEVKNRFPAEDFPLFVLFIDKGFVKLSLPKAILPQATLCFPIRQSQLCQVLMDIRDPSKHFITHSPALKNKEKPIGAMPRILYVDSSPTSRFMVRQSLQADGILCDTVPSYRDAVATLFTPASPPLVNTSKFPYDIVLIDVNSPVTGDFNGFQCTEELRSLEKKSFSGSRVPIIGVTVDPGMTLAKCLEGGMDGVCNFALAQNNSAASQYPDVLRSVVNQWLHQVPRLNLGSGPNPPNGPNSGPNSGDADSSDKSEGSSSSDGGGGGGKSGNPTRHALPAPNLAIAKSSEPTTGQKILVVEDNAMNQVVVSTFLKKAGYTFEFASDGQQAVDMYEANPFAYRLILMDCQMPVMDGYEASIRIREKEAALQIRAIPIVAMTAAALVVDRERCLAVGMSDFVQKPIQRPLFLEILEKWLKAN